MKKQKYYLPRRRKAIKRIALCIVLFLIGSFVCNVGFLPSHALRETEKYYATGKTEVIDRQFGLPVDFTGFGYFVFSANENALMHTPITCIPILSWSRCVAATVDCTEDRPIQAGFHSITGSKKSGCFVFFGRVDDADIASVEVTIKYVNSDESVSATVLPVQEFIKKNGQRYFCIWSPKETGEQSSIAAYFTVTGYGADGELIYSTKIDQGGGTVMG
jgi:hypothetical protein